MQACMTFHIKPRTVTGAFSRGGGPSISFSGLPPKATPPLTSEFLNVKIILFWYIKENIRLSSPLPQSCVYAPGLYDSSTFYVLNTAQLLQNFLDKEEIPFSILTTT